MRALFALSGILSVAGAITTSPPESNALSEFCTGLTTATSIADSALSLKNKQAIQPFEQASTNSVNCRGAPDPEINRRRLEAVNALVDISVKFKLGIERGALFSRAGFIVAKDFIYNIEQYLAGEVQSGDVKDMVGPLTKRVGKLLEDAKEMYNFFNDVQTDVNQLEFNLNNDEAHISHHIARVEGEIRKARRKRKKSSIIGGALLLVSPIFPPAAGGALAMGSAALNYDEAVQENKSFRNILQHSLSDVRHLKTIVEAAKRATATQIQYWSQTLDQLASLETTSKDWLENPESKWTAKKVLAQWKVVLQKYSECSYTVSDAGRYIQGRLQLIEQS